MFALIDGTAKARRESLKREGYGSSPLHVQYYPSFVDFYALLMSLVLLPPAMVFWCIVTAIMTPCMIAGFIYVECLPRPHDKFEGRGFNLLLTFMFPFTAIVACIAYAWWGFVLAFSYVFAAPVALVRICCGQKHVIDNNFKLLAPYWRGSSFNYAETTRAILGQADRHGFLSFLYGSPLFGSYASSICHVPILKYCWSTNPLLYELEEVFINQWTPTAEGLTFAEVKHRTQTKVGRAKHRFEERAVIDAGRFTPHYPYGMSYGVEEYLQTMEHEESIVGSQYLNCHPKLFGYTRSVWAKDSDPLKSETAQLPIFRVYLDYFGYHFLTGFVELNVSKTCGIEHPMWIIVPKHGKLGRDLYEFANILFVPYLKEALYMTTIIRDDQNRDKRMSLVAMQKKMTQSQIVNVKDIPQPQDV